MTTKDYNPNIQTFNEKPTKEASKAAAMVSKYAYWMANESSHENFINAFGKVMGDHFWNKLMGLTETRGDRCSADLFLWYEMSPNYRSILMHYILRTKYKG